LIYLIFETHNIIYNCFSLRIRDKIDLYANNNHANNTKNNNNNNNNVKPKSLGSGMTVKPQRLGSGGNARPKSLGSNNFCLTQENNKQTNDNCAL
jgi:hypothetical protein